MNIDLTIVVIFLSINLVAGLYWGRGIKTIREYAVGDRNFSTSTITATIIATWISGSFFAISVSETYKDGLWYMVFGAGDVVGLLLMGQFFAHRMKGFLGGISVAETMGNLYGKKVRLITAIASIGDALGMTAVQIKVFSSIFTHFLGFSPLAATLISSFVVITYSAFGGIKSVTFTDIIQFITFGIFVPIFAIFIWQVVGSAETISNTFQTNPLFDYHELNPANPKFWPYLFLFIYLLLPGLNPTMFQRILMARDIRQVKQTFTIAAGACLTIHLFACFIGLVILSHDPTLDPNKVAMHAIDQYSFPGLKGFALIGIMAMIMSTADSWLNTTSVIFTHDFCRPLGLAPKNELVFSRIFTIIIGVVAVLLALAAHNLLGLILLTSNFYMPTVAMPLMLAILGFRSSNRVVLISIISGILTVILWRNYIQPITDIESVIPSTVVNLIAFFTAHYLLGEPGGWTNGGNKSGGDIFRRERHTENLQSFFSNLLTNMLNFNLIEYCRTRAPKHEIVYSYFAFGVLTSLVTTFSLEREIYQQHTILINILQAIALLISTIFICNRLWPEEFREKYIGLIWYISIFMALAFISSALVLISKFSQVSLVIFILSLTAIGILLNWQTTLAMIATGSLLAFYICKKYIGPSDIYYETYDLKLQIVYILVTITGFMLAFLKPKHELQVLTEEKVEHLSERIHNKDQEVKNALQIKNEFIRNMNHEYHAPMTGIMSTVQTLKEKYHKLSDEMRKAAIDNIYQSSTRLHSLENNLTMLSQLINGQSRLNIIQLNLTDLIYERFKNCKQLYIDNINEDQQIFIIELADDVLIACDRNCIAQTLDNLIINAITYCKKGTITIRLTQNSEEVEFSISDEGIGVPNEELEEIFEAFTVSSRTRTSAGGRGVGLALCREVIERHTGRMWAKNQSDGRTIFKFTLPKIPKI